MWAETLTPVLLPNVLLAVKEYLWYLDEGCLRSVAINSTVWMSHPPPHPASVIRNPHPPEFPSPLCASLYLLTREGVVPNYITCFHCDMLVCQKQWIQLIKLTHKAVSQNKPPFYVYGSSHLLGHGNPAWQAPGPVGCADRRAEERRREHRWELTPAWNRVYQCWERAPGKWGVGEKGWVQHT